MADGQADAIARLRNVTMFGIHYGDCADPDAHFACGCKALEDIGAIEPLLAAVPASREWDGLPESADAAIRRIAALAEAIAVGDQTRQAWKVYGEPDGPSMGADLRLVAALARRAAASQGEGGLALTGDSCACGCPMVACPDCGGVRCLHCDPFCEPDSSCHEGDEVREARAGGAG